MVTLEKDSVLTDFVDSQTQNSQPRHVRTRDGRTTYLSRGDFGPLQGPRLLPELADFNLAVHGLDGALAMLHPFNLTVSVPPRCFSAAHGHIALIFGILASL